MRRTVVAAASVAPPRSARTVPPRRIVLGAAGVLTVALAVAGVLVDSGDRGTLQAAVRFEVRLAEVQPVPGLIVARVATSGEVIYLHPEMIVTNDDIAQSGVFPGGPDRFGVSVELLGSGAQRLQHATAAHVGQPVAILIDGKVVTAPIVPSAISRSAVISGDYNQKEAERIADGIARP